MNKAIIFDIHHCSTSDGPGIRTTVFFKGCNLRCAWCHNPEGQEFKPQMMFYKDKCTGCGKCTEVCPTPKNCTLCGKCSFYCPIDARKVCGKEYTVDEVFDEIIKDKAFYENSGGGVTFSGGDPFEQAENFSVLAKMVHELGLDIVTYTGYTFEQLYKGMSKNEGWRHLLEQTDILIDGKFELSKKSLNCKFRGSTNQRVLDAKKSLKEGIAIEVEI